MAALPFKVKAVFEYSSGHEDDLNFAVGQIITVTEEEGDDWYVGEYVDASGAKQDGLFPKNFVEKYEPEVPMRPTRAAKQKTEPRQPPEVETEREKPGREEDAPPVPASSKPATTQEEQVASPTTKNEPPPAPKPAPAEPVQSDPPPAKAKPPPVAPKSNAFKDRIAAFNKAEQAPIAPMGVGRQTSRNEYIKRPFVAEPPSRNAYVPPVTKAEPVHRPYIREEDPEIRKMQEEDRQAAELAGLTGDSHTPTSQTEEGDSMPKPMSLKERMAMLQKEQEAQRARHADAMQRKEKKQPVRKPSVPSEQAVAPELEEVEQSRARSGERDRRSLDIPAERPRVPSAQRRPTDQMSPVPAVPEHEILSGGEEADQSAAGETEEDDAGTIGPEDSDGKPPAVEIGVGEDGSAEDVGDEDEEELDEEELRKQRIRERMARLAGGQAGGQPFNPFGMPPAAPTKKRGNKEKRTDEDDLPSSAPQIPQMVAIPGMGGAMPPQRVQSPASDMTQKVDTSGGGSELVAADNEEQPILPPSGSTAEEIAAAPPVPKDRPVPPAPAERGLPPPVPSDVRPIHTAMESRPAPPPPPSAAPLSPGPGSESDDEMSMGAKRSSTETSGVEQALPIRTAPPPVPTPGRELPPRPLQSSDTKRSSYFGSSEPSNAISEKRMSRPPPPIPGLSSPTSPRPPPPPPPTLAPPNRQSAAVQPSEDEERGESDYEGDYDTDIASSAKHKDALKAHVREPSLDDSTTADEMTSVTTTQQQLPRAVPPPPPSQAPKAGRPSMDAPRTAPPPVPPPQSRPPYVDEVDYDPYRYDVGRAPPSAPLAVPLAAPPIPPTEGQGSDADEDESPPPLARKSTERVPPPPPHGVVPPMPSPGVLQHQPPPARALPKQSLDIQRQPTIGRRSQEGGNRQSGEFAGQMAQDVDLSYGSQWWTAQAGLPPALQSRNGVDILSESEESHTSKRGGRMTISKDIYVLYMDYSQTIITAQYDSQHPADVILEQRHQPPPSRLRQDQLESYWQRFGRAISETANAAGNNKKDNVFGDGSPPSLPLELIKRHPDALLPVGTRAYGALVYANLANASTMQFDEIRPGDIITVRNAKFEGHHGAMKTKYKSDYGPSHVGIVEEWDGTRRTIRAWEQGREKKAGVRSEKFRLGDLRSGEVRVWRVVGREWVGWAN